MRTVIVLAVLAAAAPAAAETPKVKLDRVVALGALPADKVQRPLARLTKQFAACHADRQLTARIYGGTVAVAFTITPDGAVEAPAASGLDLDVATCVAAAVATLVFPTRTDPTAVTFAVGFRVRADKARDRAAALARAAGDVDAGMDAVDLAGDIHDAYQRDFAAASYSLAGGSRPGARSTAVVDVGRYAGPEPAAAADPSTPRTPAPLSLSLGILLAHADALRACLSPTPASVRFSLDIAATGTVTSITAHGAADPDRHACLTTAAAPIRFPSLPGGTLLVVTFARADDAATTVSSPVP